MPRRRKIGLPLPDLPSPFSARSSRTSSAVASSVQPSPLDRFRSSSHRQPLHPLEQAVLVSVCTTLAFLPWAVGSSRPWAQITGCCLAGLSLLIALLPRTYVREYAAGPGFRLLTWPRLIRFPIFWLGLLLLAWITTQALNPAWVRVTDGQYWWLFPRLHIDWLPTSVRAPFLAGNTWRYLMNDATAWLTVCAIWIGFTRRRTLQRFFVVLAAQGVLLGLLAMAQRLTGATQVFWSVTSANPEFFASFIYKNHAGAYLNLILEVSVALSAWYYFRGLRRMEKSNPAGLFAFFACVLAVDIFVSLSRASLAMMALFFAVALAIFFIHLLRNPGLPRKPSVLIAMVSIFAVFAALGLRSLSADRAWDRVQQLFAERDTSFAMREQVTQAAMEMYREHWLTGTGANDFRFLFPPYQKKYPLIYGGNGHPQLYWEHVHNDLLEIPLELGLPAVVILLCGAGYWFVLLVRHRAIDHPFCLIVVAGCLLTVLHARWDFVFQNPAILVTWCALWPATVRWLQEQK